MITVEPPPGSVITWRMCFTPNGAEYQYGALHVAGRGWYTTSTRFGSRALMWSEVQTLIGYSPCALAMDWAYLNNAGQPVTLR